MTDGDDSDTWREAAVRYAELAAQQIARFKNPWWNPTWRDLVPPRSPAIAVAWGSRGRRSRHTTRFVKRGHSIACSPETPLDFGSGAGFGSRSASEEASSSTDKAAGAAKRRRVADGADVSGAKMVVTEKAPAVLRVAAAKDGRRTGKKKTLCELQEEEKLLLREKIMMQKEMELRRRAYGVLKAENQRLKDQQVQPCRYPVVNGVSCQGMVVFVTLCLVFFFSYVG